MSELRKDPTRGQWVLVRPTGAMPTVGADCPFCPGNEGLTPAEIVAYRKEGSAPDGAGWSVRVIPEADRREPAPRRLAGAAGRRAMGAGPLDVRGAHPGPQAGPGHPRHPDHAAP